MNPAVFIHPGLSVLAAICILTAYGIRLFKSSNNTLHYWAGITAFVLLVFSVIRAMIVARNLAARGVVPPMVMNIHGINAMLIGLLLITQVILGIVMWRKKPDVPIRAFMVHSLVGPVLALLVIVQVVLGVLTMLSLMG